MDTPTAPDRALTSIAIALPATPGILGWATPLFLQKIQKPQHH